MIDEVVAPVLVVTCLGTLGFRPLPAVRLGRGSQCIIT